MCTHNAGRSQMAAALLAREAGRAVRVTSAGGLDPGQRGEPGGSGGDGGDRGGHLAGRCPSRWRPGQAEAADIVISMGCGDACPVFPGWCYPGMGAARPRRADRGAGPSDPRRNRRAGPRAARRPRRTAEAGADLSRFRRRRCAARSGPVSRHRPWWRPIRSRVPTTRNPACSCRRRLAMFSGNTPDWMVQMPACSAEAIRVASRAAPIPRRRSPEVDVDTVLDHPGVDTPSDTADRGGPAQHLPGALVGGDVPVPGELDGVEGLPLRGGGLEAARPVSSPAW